MMVKIGLGIWDNLERERKGKLRIWERDKEGKLEEKGRREEEIIREEKNCLIHFMCLILFSLPFLYTIV